MAETALCKWRGYVIKRQHKFRRNCCLILDQAGEACSSWICRMYTRLNLSSFSAVIMHSCRDLPWPSSRRASLQSWVKATCLIWQVVSLSYVVRFHVSQCLDSRFGDSGARSIQTCRNEDLVLLCNEHARFRCSEVGTRFLGCKSQARTRAGSTRRRTTCEDVDSLECLVSNSFYTVPCSCGTVYN